MRLQTMPQEEDTQQMKRRLFSCRILGAKWDYKEDDSMEDYGMCSYNPKSGGEITINPVMHSHERLNTLIHETFHAAFKHLHEDFAALYGDAAAGLLLSFGISQSGKGRSARQRLMEQADYSLKYIREDYRRQFVSDLTEVLKQDRWYINDTFDKVDHDSLY